MARETWTFVAVGQNDIVQAYRSIGAESVKAGRASVAGSSARQRAEEKWAGQAQRAADKALKATQRTEEQRWRAVERTGKRIEREFEREAKAAERTAARRAAAEAKANRQIAQERARTIGRIASGAAGLAATGGLAVAGLAGAAARAALITNEKANRISISARQGGIEGVDPAALAKLFRNIAISTPGVSSEQLAGATQKFQAMTGQLLNAEQLQTLATASSAAGADVEDVTAAVAALSKTMKVNSVEDMQQALSTLIEQGARGSFELKDAASQYEKLTAAAGRFGGVTGVKGVATLGGLTQISRSATGSPEQAASALEATFRQLVKNSPKLAKAGVNVFDKSGATRDIVPVLLETIANVGGKDIAKKKVGLQEIFGEEGIRAISPLIAAFADATVEGKDGMAAMQSVVNDAMQSTRTWKDVQQDAAQAQQDTSAKMAAAWERVQEVAADRLLPALLPIIEQAPDLVTAITPLIGIFGDLAGAVLDFMKLLPGVDAAKIERQQQRAKSQAALREVNKTLSDMPKNGPPTAEQAEALRKKAALEYELSAMDAADKAAADGGAAGPEMEGAGGLRGKGLLVGAGVGAAVAGKPGAVIGGGIGLGIAEGSIAQGEEAGRLRQQGFIETPSGAMIPVGGAGSAGAPQIDTKEAQKGLTALAGALLAAASKINNADIKSSSDKPTAVPIL